MAKTNLGKVALTPKGTYSADYTYEALDFVTAGDSSYASLQDNNLGHPVTDEAWWQPLASGAAATAAAGSARQAADNANAAAAAAALVQETIGGSAVTLDVVGNHEYLCGELASLKLNTVETSPLLSIIRFTSGAAATELILPGTLKVEGWRIPQANRPYAVFIHQGTATIVYYE